METFRCWLLLQYKSLVSKIFLEYVIPVHLVHTVICADFFCQIQTSSAGHLHLAVAVCLCINCLNC